MATVESILSRCVQNSVGCDVWQGAKRGRYGVIGHEGKQQGVHRVMLTLTAGPPPSDKHEASHGPCNNPACCTASHLTWKTKSENERDKKRDGTSIEGERHPRAKLSKSQVARLRKRHVPGCRVDGVRALARETGMSYSQMQRILAVERWSI
jgi:hypothetical protein